MALPVTEGLEIPEREQGEKGRFEMRQDEKIEGKKAGKKAGMNERRKEGRIRDAKAPRTEHLLYIFPSSILFDVLGGEVHSIAQ